jgi:di/tricarboxylate transporter
MNYQMIVTLLVIIFSIGLLISNRIRPDLVALLVLLSLGLTGVVAPDKVFSGFSSSAVITILGISMIAVGLQRTGATNSLGNVILKIGGQNETRLILTITLASAFLSLFMNNIAAVGVLLPAVMSLSQRAKISASRLLIPLSFGTILGGMATLLTTSNIIVSTALKEAGHPSFGLLDFLPVGGPVVIVGIIYMVTIGKKLLPGKSLSDQDFRNQKLQVQLRYLRQDDAAIHHFPRVPDSPNANPTLDQREPDNHFLSQKALLAILITLITLVVAAIGIFPIAQVVLSGAALMMLTGCMNLNDAYQGIEWKAIFLISGLWPLSLAIKETGLATTAIDQLLNLFGSSSTIVIIAMFLFITMMLTLIISGQVSAIVMIPLAISAANGLGIDPRPLAFAVAMGSSLAFLTPMAHPVNIMVMDPGGYSFKDYFRVGLPLTFIAFLTVLIAIQVNWGL